MEKNTLLNQVRNLRKEAEAYEFVEKLRWKGPPGLPPLRQRPCLFLDPQGRGPEDPYRQGVRAPGWKCGACRRQFSALTGTIFHGTKVELRIWLMVLVEMCANKNGMAAREIERKYGVSPKTAWFMAHRIREAMRSQGSFTPDGRDHRLSDEAWIGGNPKRMNAKTRHVGRVMAWTLSSRPRRRRTARHSHREDPDRLAGER